MNPEAVTGLCHLVANEIQKRFGGEIIGVATGDNRIWHYGVELDSGKVLDSKGVWDSKEEFVAMANKKWEREFEIVYPELPSEEINVFNETEHRKARMYVKDMEQHLNLI